MSAKKLVNHALRRVMKKYARPCQFQLSMLLDFLDEVNVATRDVRLLQRFPPVESRDLDNPNEGTIYGC